MRIQTHPLHGASSGTRRELTSFHYGPTDAGRKVYVQASLHADELPGMLVAHHLRQRLAVLEAVGRLRGEVVVVPVANPIGLGQAVLRSAVGRFELASGENFNRHYPVLFDGVLARIDGRLGSDAAANTVLIRAALRETLAQHPADNELASLRKTLLGLACDAEVVLDLHCDCEAVVHLYTATPLWPQAEPLARLLGSQAQLLALDSGDHPFDETCSSPWWQLAQAFEGRSPIEIPVELGCLSVTVELRGEADVTQVQAAADADALVAFLTHRGLVDGPAPVLPPLLRPATPLTGTDVIATPVSGVVAYLADPGDWVRAGDTVAEVIDAISGTVTALKTATDGVLFAREHRRYASAGRPLLKVAGATPIRSGKLSSQ